MIYLASPYSHSDATIREQRFREACLAAAELIRNGEVVFSPIAHSHPIAAYGLPSDWWFWERHDLQHLTRCDEIVVLTLDGWRESEGVHAEIRISKELGKQVRYLEPETQLFPTLAHVTKERNVEPNGD
jgi:nucleoside 2-deoxyribosyltransferase